MSSVSFFQPILEVHFSCPTSDRISQECDKKGLAKLLALFQQSNDFRGEKAQAALQDAAQLYLSELDFEKFREECLSFENIQSRLLMAWLKNNEIFERACGLYVIDSITRGGWRLRTGIGNHEIDTTFEAMQHPEFPEKNYSRGNSGYKTVLDDIFS